MIANLGNLMKLFVISNTPCCQKTINLLQELVKYLSSSIEHLAVLKLVDSQTYVAITEDMNKFFEAVKTMTR